MMLIIDCWIAHHHFDQNTNHFTLILHQLESGTNFYEFSAMRSLKVSIKKNKPRTSAFSFDQQLAQRKEMEQNLFKYQRLYESVVHNFPDGVIGVLNKEMKYVLLDGKDLNTISLSPLGIGKKYADSADPAMNKKVLTKINEAFSGQNVFFELSESDKFYTISAVPLRDSQNNINEVLCIVKDVTDKKKLEAELLKALEHEKELNDLKSRFVTMASHEFKTPLATILSSAFLLENFGSENFNQEKLIHTNRIRRSVNNLTIIINDILSLEKLEENLIKVVLKKLNLPQFMEELITEMDSLKQVNQTIVYHHAGELTDTMVDPNLLYSICANLISNAIKYSDCDGEITVATEIKDSKVYLTVSDHGIGIPPEEHHHIFERFYRAKNTVNIIGTGLGLHIVEKNVKLLGGTITFTSELNGETKFSVTLATNNPILLEK